MFNSRATVTRSILRPSKEHFGCDVDYAMLVKLFGKDQNEYDRRYSPAVCMGCTSQFVSGDPDLAHISTSFAERHNWSVRASGVTLGSATGSRANFRITRQRSRSTISRIISCGFTGLRVTPAMAAGVTNRLFEVSHLLALLEAEEKAAERAA